MRDKVKGFFVALEEKISLPGERIEEKLRKTILTVSSFAICIAGLVWGVMYAMLGFYDTSLAPFGFSFFVGLSLLHFFLTKKYALFRFMQVFLILILPFLVQWNLGGFVGSGAVMLWGVLAPLGALLFYGVRIALRWFYLYLVLAIVTVFLDGWLAPNARTLSLEVVQVFFAMNIVVVSILIFFMSLYFITRMQDEKDHADKLLLNILPEKIVERLKRDPDHIADGFPEVTVLLADIVDFTSLSMQIPPARLVELLNRIFSHFDRLVDLHGLEKIKTIGDNYMLVAGMPEFRRDHAQAVADVALSMREDIRRFKLVSTKGKKRGFQLRIGINTGPAVAGVIGQRKFCYDIWGDTVNIASRMESLALPGSIQVSEDSYYLLRERYEFEERGKIQVKGRGLMTTYFLKGEKPAPPADA